MQWLYTAHNNGNPILCKPWNPNILNRWLLNHHSPARALTAYMVSANAFSLAANIKISALKRV